LQEVEKTWTRPTGFRRVVKLVILFLADWVPPTALLAALAVVLWRTFDPRQVGYQVHTADYLMPVAVLVATLVMLHLLIILMLPLRWSAIRSEFHAQLEVRVRRDMEAVFAPVPTDLAEALREERRKVEKLIADTREVASWLEKREQSASITGLYGH
jgi:hypothetical protein